MNILFIRLSEEIITIDSLCECVAFGSASEFLGDEANIPLAKVDNWMKELSAETSFKTFILLSGELVLINQVSIPSSQKKHIDKALPFLVEDQLACDLESVFIATGEKQGDLLNVAVVNKDTMVQLQEVFAELNLIPELMLPDFMALELIKNGFSALIENDRVLLNFNGKGMTAEPQLLPLLISSIVEELEEIKAEENEKAESNLDDEKPKGVVTEPLTINADVYLSTELEDDACKAFIASDIDINMHRYEGLTVTQLGKRVLAEQKQGVKFLNLLQKQFKPKRTASTTKFQLNFNWKALLVMFAIFVVSYCSFVMYESYELKKAATQVEKDIRFTYKQIFPKTRNFSRMKKRIKDLLETKGDTQEIVFLQGMQILGNSVKKINEKDASLLKIKQINFDAKNQEFKLDVIAADFDALNLFKVDTEDAGFKVEISSANAEKEGVKGRLKMRLGQ